MQHARERMAQKGTAGSFRRIARHMHMTTGEAARHIMANKDEYSPAVVKKANFARNVAK